LDRLRNLVRRDISLPSMMMRLLAGCRLQRVPFFLGQIRKMADEGHNFPDLFVGVGWAEGGHGGHTDAMFDDPEEFSVCVILSLSQRWCARIDSFG